MPDSDATLFTVTDLKQFIYCPRILYYHTCLPDIRPTTRKMQLGIQRHDDEHKRSLRRNMHLPNIEHASRESDVPLLSTKLGLSGQVDELLIFDDVVVPIDYKLAKKAGAHFKLQIAAYAMMAEESYNLPAPRGLLYLIRTRKTVEVNVSRHWRNKVHEAIDTMRQIADSENMPAPTDKRRACIDCEFRRFCNDV